MALVLLWIATAAFVLGAHFMHPASRVRLELTARTIGFTVGGEAEQLLLSTTHLESLTIAGFGTIEPQGRRDQAITGATGSSLTLRESTLDGISAAPGTRIRINKEPEDPGVRLTIALGSAQGTVHALSSISPRCHLCGDGKELGWLESRTLGAVGPLVWTSRTGSGGTDVLLTGPEKLVMSNDDLLIEGAFDVNEPDGPRIVSTLHSGEVEFPGVAPSVTLQERSRLRVDIQSGTGIIKTLTVDAKGVSVVIEGRAETVSVEAANQRDDLLPSYLEIIFHSKSWLLLAQAVVLVGGTLARILLFLKKGDAT